MVIKLLIRLWVLLLAVCDTMLWSIMTSQNRFLVWFSFFIIYIHFTYVSLFFHSFNFSFTNNELIITKLCKIFSYNYLVIPLLLSLSFIIVTHLSHYRPLLSQIIHSNHHLKKGDEKKRKKNVMRKFKSYTADSLDYYLGCITRGGIKLRKIVNSLTKSH